MFRTCVGLWFSALYVAGLVACAPSDQAAPTEEAEVVLGTPDLVIGGAEVTVDGSQLRYAFDVKNEGDGSAPGFYVHVMIDGEAATQGSRDYDRSVYVESINAGGRLPVSITVDAQPGEHTSWLYVDTDNQITELDEENNTFGPLSIEVRAPGPDLMVEVVSAAWDGENSTYEVNITNYGDAPAENFYVDLFEDVTADPEECSYGDLYTYISIIEPGETYTWSATSYYSSTLPENFEAVVYVDSCNAVEEYDESDNLAWVSVSL